MNREIKFRGLSIHPEGKGKWIHGTLLTNKLGTYIITEKNPHECTQYGYLEIDEYERVDPKTVGQYTGLKDNNGVEIYEGDYLKNHKKNILEVVFEKGQFLFEHKTGRYAEKGWAFKYDATGTGDELEIIGNIYENPELLEVSK